MARSKANGTKATYVMQGTMKKKKIWGRIERGHSATGHFGSGGSFNSTDGSMKARPMVQQRLDRRLGDGLADGAKGMTDGAIESDRQRQQKYRRCQQPSQTFVFKEEP